MPNVKRDKLKLALMDFDEEGERYKQVKSVTSQHSVVDLTDNEHHRAVEDENRN